VKAAAFGKAASCSICLVGFLLFDSRSTFHKLNQLVYIWYMTTPMW